MELLSSTGPVFGEGELGLWLWFIVALPLLFVGIFAYLAFRADSPGERILHLIWLGLTLLFLAVPWMINENQNALRVAFEEDTKQLILQDRLSALPYAIPFRDFRAYLSRTEVKTDSDGSKTYTYSLSLLHKKSYAILLHRTSDKKAHEKAFSLAKAVLPLPRTEGVPLSASGGLKWSSIRLLQKPELLCNQGFSMIETEQEDGICRLSWPVRLHPALLIGIFLPLFIAFFLIFRIYHENHLGLWVVLGFVLLILSGFIYVTLRSWNATQRLELSKERLAVWIDSPVLGRSMAAEFPASEIRYAGAQLGSSDHSLLFAPKNPLAGKADMQGLGLIRSALSYKAAIAGMDGLPVRDRLLLLDTLLFPAEW